MPFNFHGQVKFESMYLSVSFFVFRCARFGVSLDLLDDAFDLTSVSWGALFSAASAISVFSVSFRRFFIKPKNGIDKYIHSGKKLKR